MPKSTFYNLNEDKKRKIIKAIEKEFTSKSFDKASISNIVEEAKIPRGSFYQYFEDKEDALKYIIQDFLDKEKEEIKNLLIKNNGDIFTTVLDIYSCLVEKSYNENEKELLQNIISKLRNDNVNIFREIQFRRYTDIKKLNNNNNNYINLDMLNIEEDEEILPIMRILTCVLRAEIIDVMHGKISKEEGKKELIKQIQILKRGMTK